MVKKTLNKKTAIFPPTQGATAAATATAEEFSAEASPHPIAPRDEISRSGNPSLRPNIIDFGNLLVDYCDVCAYWSK